MPVTSHNWAQQATQWLNNYLTVRWIICECRQTAEESLALLPYPFFNKIAAHFRCHMPHPCHRQNRWWPQLPSCLEYRTWLEVQVLQMHAAAHLPWTNVDDTSTFHRDLLWSKTSKHSLEIAWIVTNVWNSREFENDLLSPNHTYCRHYFAAILPVSSCRLIAESNATTWIQVDISPWPYPSIELGDMTSL